MEKMTLMIVRFGRTSQLRSKTWLKKLLAPNPRQGSSFFAHTLQLVIGDKETKLISAALAKTSRLSSLLHTSTSFKENSEKEFGQRGIPASVTMRWNATLRQLKAVFSCDHLRLCIFLENVGHKETIFTAREWNQIQELVQVLQPFAEAADLTQGEKNLTISAVAPCVLSLNHHLENQKESMCYLGSLICNLKHPSKGDSEGSLLMSRWQMERVIGHYCPSLTLFT